MNNQERLKIMHDKVAQLHDDLVEQRIEDAKKGIVSTRYIALEHGTEPEEVPEIINICGTLLHHITCLREMELKEPNHE